MAKKNKKRPIDFSNQSDILNFRPHIGYVEPDQIEEDTTPTPINLNTPATLDQNKSDAVELMEGYKEVETLADLAQKRIDARAKELVIHLDDEQDAHILAALQRHFGPNKKTITYDDYKQCINDIYENSDNNFININPVDIEAGASDPFRNTFGTMGLQDGLGRPELDKSIQAIKPINIKDFQSGQLVELVKLILPELLASKDLGEFVVKKAVEAAKDLL